MSDTNYVDMAEPGVNFYWVLAIFSKDGKPAAAGKASPYAWAVVK